MRIWVLVVSVFLTGLVFARPVLSGNCISDNDCKKKMICHVGRCTKISKKESLLDVTLEEWVANATLSIDNVPMGNLPWQGIVSAGRHTIKIEAPGYQTLEVAGTARGGVREPIQFRLEPAAGLPPTAAPSASAALPPPPPSGQYDSSYLPPPGGESYDYAGLEGEGEDADDEAGDSDGDKEPGMLAIGAFGAGGYGTAMWGDSTKRPASSVYGGGLFSVRFVTDPIWFELGIAGSYGAHFVKDWPGQGDVSVTELHVGLLPRLLFSLVDDFFYLGGEVEAGMAISSDYYILLQARVDLAFMVNEWLEIRLNPAGFEWLQETGGQGAFLGYTGNIGVAYRFL